MTLKGWFCLFLECDRRTRKLPLVFQKEDAKRKKRSVLRTSHLALIKARARVRDILVFRERTQPWLEFGAFPDQRKKRLLAVLED